MLLKGHYVLHVNGDTVSWTCAQQTLKPTSELDFNRNILFNVQKKMGINGRQTSKSGEKKIVS